MIFKQCGISEALLVRDIAEQTYRETFEAHNKKADMDEYAAQAFSVQRMEQELDNPASVFFLALIDGQVGGYLKLNHAAAQTELNDSDSIEIERIYLFKAFQGQGNGRALMDYALEYAAERQKSFVWLGVWEKNLQAIRFYERNGFYRFGEHLFQLGGDAQLDYLMRKDLR